jgi:hypothetical protein
MAWCERGGCLRVFKTGAEPAKLAERPKVKEALSGASAMMLPAKAIRRRHEDKRYGWSVRSGRFVENTRGRSRTAAPGVDQCLDGVSVVHVPWGIAPSERQYRADDARRLAGLVEEA